MNNPLCLFKMWFTLERFGMSWFREKNSAIINSRKFSLPENKHIKSVSFTRLKPTVVNLVLAFFIFHRWVEKVFHLLKVSFCLLYPLNILSHSIFYSFVDCFFSPFLMYVNSLNLSHFFHTFLFANNDSNRMFFFF